MLTVDKDRHMIPRWRDSHATSLQGELGSPGRLIQLTGQRNSEIDSRLQDWKETKSASFASDLVGAAIVGGHPELASDAARFLLEHDDGVSFSARRMAKWILSRDHKESSSSLNRDQADQISRLRKLKAVVRTSPRNALAWVDLSREYTAKGQSTPALNAMIRGLALAPENRFVLRAAVRLFVQQGEPDRGLRLLRRSRRTSTDSWLMAAEVGVSTYTGVSPAFIRQARLMSSSGRVDPFHLAELNSALGTLELGAGAVKKSRKLFRLSLEEPNENAVAQAEWASRHITELAVKDEHLLNIPRTYEARAIVFRDRGAWKDAVEQTWSWLEDEPFSTEPARFGSYIASMGLLNDKEAVRISEAGLNANPNDSVLLNNLAFSLAGLNRLDEAERVLSKISSESSEDVFAARNATEGMIAYRRSDHLKGKQCYLGALGHFRSQGSMSNLAVAAICWAREAKLAGAPEAIEAMRVVEDSVKGIQDPEIKAWVSLLGT